MNELSKDNCHRCGYIVLADSEDWDHPLCPDCHQSHGPNGIFDLAINEINNVLFEGEKTHKKDEWRNGSKKALISMHEEHAFQHIEQAIDQFHYGDKASELEELSHAATRCLMALQLFLEERNEEVKG